MTFAINPIFLVGLLLLALPPTAESLADNAISDRYALPQSKSALESCRQAALIDRPGQVLAYQIRNTATGFHYHFEIKAQDQAHWLVICEGTHLKIIRNQRQE